ncbi:MAG TPA: gamma-glutamylcyclotransferase family protein [Candidatus Saccharimonadales bacterium]|nr:gamma-glutamylcyclotransferase family protein [Candidatus Saccharimonadales bacterium]
MTINTLIVLSFVRKIRVNYTAQSMARGLYTEKLFTYGTLQTEEVQLETFGRLLEGHADALPQYTLKTIEIQDQEFVAKSGTAIHRNLEFTGAASDYVEGTVYSVTQQELEQADAYEPEGYKRLMVELKSGAKAWVYVNQS